MPLVRRTKSDQAMPKTVDLKCTRQVGDVHSAEAYRREDVQQVFAKSQIKNKKHKGYKIPRIRVHDQNTISENEASALLGKSTKTLWRWRQIGYGPPFKMDGRWVWYNKSGLQGWKERHQHRRTPSDALVRAAVANAAYPEE